MTIIVILSLLLMCIWIFCSSIFDEAKVIFMGMQHAKRLGVTFLWVESVSVILINVLNDLSVVPWNIIYIVRAIKSLLRYFQEFPISHICSEGNICVDIMANWRITNKTSFQFENLRILPKEARGALRLDKFGLPGFRKKET